MHGLKRILKIAGGCLLALAAVLVTLLELPFLAAGDSRDGTDLSLIHI